jgi:hypothetical protein
VHNLRCESEITGRSMTRTDRAICYSFIWFSVYCRIAEVKNRTVALTVRRWLLTVESWVQSRVISCEIRCGRSGIEVRFSFSSVFTANLYSITSVYSSVTAP